MPGGHLQMIQIVSILCVKREVKDEVKVINALGKATFYFSFPLVGKLSTVTFKNSLYF